MNQIYWTAEVNKVIRGGLQGVKEYHEKLMSQVREGEEEGRGKEQIRLLVHLRASYTLHQLYSTTLHTTTITPHTFILAHGKSC